MSRPMVNMGYTHMKIRPIRVKAEYYNEPPSVKRKREPDYNIDPVAPPPPPAPQPDYNNIYPHLPPPPDLVSETSQSPLKKRPVRVQLHKMLDRIDRLLEKVETQDAKRRKKDEELRKSGIFMDNMNDKINSDVEMAWSPAKESIKQERAVVVPNGKQSVGHSKIDEPILNTGSDSQSDSDKDQYEDESQESVVMENCWQPKSIGRMRYLAKIRKMNGLTNGASEESNSQELVEQGSQTNDLPSVSKPEIEVITIDCSDESIDSEVEMLIQEDLLAAYN